MADRRDDGTVETSESSETSRTTRAFRTTGPGGSGAGPATRRARGRALLAQPVLAAALVLALIAGGCAVWAGWSWYDAAHDDSASYAAERDAALAAAEQGVQNLNSLDHRSLDRGLDLWEQSTTGELHQQLVDGRTEFETQVKEARTVTTAEVLSGAVTELDERAGRARVLVAVRVTVRAPEGEPTDKDSRMVGELTRTEGRWKLSALGQAPIGDTATG